MLIIRRPDQYNGWHGWLHCPVAEVPDFFTQYPVDRFRTSRAETESQHFAGNAP